MITTETKTLTTGAIEFDDLPQGVPICCWKDGEANDQIELHLITRLPEKFVLSGPEFENNEEYLEIDFTEDRSQQTAPHEHQCFHINRSLNGAAAVRVNITSGEGADRKKRTTAIYGIAKPGKTKQA